MITKAALLTFRNDGHELLFVRPKGKDYLIFPGGKQESEETIDEALGRELNEELGVKAKNILGIGTVTGKTPDGRDMEMHLFGAELVGDPKPHAEIEELFWLTRDDVARYDAMMTPMTRDHVLPLLKAQKIW